MAHDLWSEFSYYGFRVRHALTAIEDRALKMQNDPGVSLDLKRKYVEIQAKAMFQGLNIDYGCNLRAYVDPLGEGVTVNGLESERIDSLTKALGDLMCAYTLMLDGPLDENMLCRAVNELDHGGGGLNLPPPPPNAPPPPPPPPPPPVPPVPVPVAAMAKRAKPAKRRR